MNTNLTDFSYDDLLFMANILNTQLQECLIKIQFLQDNFSTSDLLPYYQDQYDKTQRWTVKVKEAAIQVRTREKILLN